MRAPFSLPHAAAVLLRFGLDSDLLAPLKFRLVLALAPASKKGKGRRNSRVAHEIFNRTQEIEQNTLNRTKDRPGGLAPPS